MRWRNSFYTPHKLVLNAARNNSLYTQDSPSNFLMALIWHLSPYKFYPLVLALLWAPSENLQFPNSPIPCDSCSVSQVFSSFLALCSQLLQPNSHGMCLSLSANLTGMSRNSWLIFIPGCHIKKTKLNFYYMVEPKYHFSISKYYHWSI